MKRILIAAVALLACVGMANAGGYRGAVDLGIGAARHGESHFEVSTTHGYVVPTSSWVVVSDFTIIGM